MNDDEDKGQWVELEKGHKPISEGWVPGIRGGYQPETSEAGNPPTGGGGGKEPVPEPKK